MSRDEDVSRFGQHAGTHVKDGVDEIARVVCERKSHAVVFAVFKAWSVVERLAVDISANCNGGCDRLKPGQNVGSSDVSCVKNDVDPRKDFGEGRVKETVGIGQNAEFHGLELLKDMGPE